MAAFQSSVLAPLKGWGEKALPSVRVSTKIDMLGTLIFILSWLEDYVFLTGFLDCKSNISI